MPRHPGERRQLEIPPHCLTSYPTELRSHKVSCGSGHKMGVAGRRRRKDSPQPLCKPDLRTHHTGVCGLSIPVLIRTVAVTEIDFPVASLYEPPTGVGQRFF